MILVVCCSMKAWIGSLVLSHDSNHIIFSFQSPLQDFISPSCSPKNIPFPFHPSLIRQHAALSPKKTAGTFLTNDSSFSEHDFTPQDCHTRPIQKLNAFVWRIITTVMQVSVVLKPSWRELASVIPDHYVCVGSYLNCAFLRV